MKANPPERLPLRALVLLGALASAPLVSHAQPELRGAYATIWDSNTTAALDAIVASLAANHLNAVFPHIRVRGDAYYIPNRDDATYPNPEPRAQLYSVTPDDLDVLQYLIDRCHPLGIEVHAWVVFVNTWNRSTPPSAPSHIWNAHRDWITHDRNGTQMPWDGNGGEGGFADPGVPEWQEHIYNVVLDIVRNYDVDGVHFDYVRYPDMNPSTATDDYGYHPTARARFAADTGLTMPWPGGFSGSAAEWPVWRFWRTQQLAGVLTRIGRQIHLDKPWVVISPFLVQYQDSLIRNGQNHAFWGFSGAMDFLMPSAYASGLSTNMDRIRDNVLRRNARGAALPVAVAPAAAYDYNTGAQMRDLIGAVRGEPGGAWGWPTPDLYVGFTHFDYGGLTEVAPGDPSSRFQQLSGPGYPYAGAAVVPLLTNRAADTVPPNPPAAVSVTSPQTGVARVTFSRPAAATDGDLPIQYRIYRDTVNPVRRWYDHLRMVFHDDPPTRTAFSWDDTQFPGSGTWFYQVVAFDDWHREAAAAVQSVAITSPAAVIVESRPGGQNFAFYSESSGNWANSTVKSSAPGVTAGIGSRYATLATRDDVCRFTVPIPAAGQYEVFLTTDTQTSHNADNCTIRIGHAGGTTTLLRNVDAATMGDIWYSLGTYTFSAGSTHFVELDSSTCTTSGTDRLNADAVRLVPVSAPPAPWEPFPTRAEAPPVPGATFVADDCDLENQNPTTPYAGSFDDGPGWSTSTFQPQDSVNGALRYTGDYPSSPAMWAVYLPVPGRYRIEGHIRPNSTLTTTATYTFRHQGATVSRTLSQRSATGGWSLNIDGLASDAEAFQFDAGMTFVVLRQNATVNTGLTFADAIRFRFVGPQVPVGVAYFGTD